MALQELRGRTALVTGGARGIGLALTSALRAEGMRVVVTDQDEQALADAVRELGSDDVLPRVLDVSSPEAWEEVVDEVWRQVGPVDLLVNNAGMGVGAAPGTSPPRVWELPVEKFRQVVDVNLVGTLLGMRALLPRMIARGTPAHVVNVASMAGFLAPPGLGAYAASKFAVVALSEVAAAELQEHGIGLSVVSPGGVATPFNESARRFGSSPQPTRPTDPAATDARKMAPASVADRVVRAIVAGDLHVFSHPEYAPLVAERQAAIAAAFGTSAEPGYRDPEDLLSRSRSPLHRPG
ncbi:SDR family oxidoreductase [Nocardioides sp. Y6]|uniref:SDR family oxidoreductase n=1 Tax=Nocardioides malaquae TaxID=2773426 RepID=A0ABR9RTQ3_9ACTN|nr:SDR family oxidoreductase [Nocardioides malaquae]MBE7324755.1 SDR family oxidoreductase [Nocardioides malaquae]